MNDTIYKYVLGNRNWGDTIKSIDVPIGSKFLSAKAQGEDICLWYAVNSEEKEMRSDRWYQIGTGHHYNPIVFDINKATFVDTIVNDDMGLVWHIFVKEGKE